VGDVVSVGLAEPVTDGLPVPVGLTDPVLVVAVGETLRLPVGLGDLDAEALGDVPRLTPAGTGPAVLPGCVRLADGLAGCVGDDVGEIVVLLSMLAVGWLLDSSTATIAMTPIAAAPIPA
jgi:hypothetical protein